MKISQGIESFSHERALLLACGETCAKMHFAHQGRVDYLGSVMVPTTTFSDREGFFMSTGRGMVFRAGSVYEDQKEFRHRRFAQELVEAVDRHVTNLHITTIYLFCPEHVAHAIRGVLEKKHGRLIRMVLPGNYVEDHPFLLIGKIERARRDDFAVLHEPRSEQERKLLKRTAFGPRLAKMRRKEPS